MTRPSPVAAIPAALLPAKSSSELVSFYVRRRMADGILLKAIAADAGLAGNFLSMLAHEREELPLPRLLPLAHALGLHADETTELLRTRLIELNGAKTQLCLGTIAAFMQLQGLIGADRAEEEALLEEYGDALANDFFARSDIRARVREFKRSLCAEELDAQRAG